MIYESDYSSRSTPSRLAIGSKLALTLAMALTLATALMQSVPASELSATTKDQSGAEQLDFRVRLLTPDEERSRIEIMEYLEKSGGHLSLYRPGQMVVRLPSRLTLAEVEQQLAGSGLILERQLTRSYLGQEIVDLEARIAARTTQLAALRRELTRSNLSESLEIEKEIYRVIGQIEEMKGRLNLLNDRVARMSVTIQFQSEREPGSEPALTIPFVERLRLPTFLELFP